MSIQCESWRIALGKRARWLSVKTSRVSYTMNFVDRFVQSDRGNRLPIGVVMPLIMPLALLAVVRMLEYAGVVSFLICLLVTIVGFGIHYLLQRLFLGRLSMRQQSIIGIIGWFGSIPALFLVTKYYLLR